MVSIIPLHRYLCGLLPQLTLAELLPPGYRLDLDPYHAVEEWDDDRQPWTVNAQQFPEPEDNETLIPFSHGQRLRSDT